MRRAEAQIREGAGTTIVIQGEIDGGFHGRRDKGSGGGGGGGGERELLSLSWVFVGVFVGGHP